MHIIFYAFFIFLISVRLYGLYFMALEKCVTTVISENYTCLEGAVMGGEI